MISSSSLIFGDETKKSYDEAQSNAFIEYSETMRS